MTNLQLQVKYTRSLLQFLSVFRFHFTLGKAGFGSKSVNSFPIPNFFPDSETPWQQLQHAEMYLCHKIKTEGARIYFRFNNKSQWNLHTSHHFGSKSTNSLSNSNIIAYSEPPWCLLPLTTLSSIQNMKNEATGGQICVKFEHAGVRRWPLNSSSAAKSQPISVLSYPENQWRYHLTHTPKLPSEKSHTRCAGVGLGPCFALKSRQNVAKVGNPPPLGAQLNFESLFLF